MQIIVFHLLIFAIPLAIIYTVALQILKFFTKTTPRFLGFLLVFFFCSWKISLKIINDIQIEKARTSAAEENVINYAKSYMYEKYGENFILIDSRPSYTGERRGGYNFTFISEKYKDTPHLDDFFYKASVSVGFRGRKGKEKINNVSDLYQLNYMTIKIEEYFSPILTKLFGEMTRQALNFHFDWDLPREDVPEMIRRSGSRLSGSIYIFDRIESQDQIKNYEEKIFQFVSYLKENNIFNNVHINFFITDERILGDNNRETEHILSNAYFNLGYREFLNYREELLENLGDSYYTLTEEEKIYKMNSIDKENLLNYHRRYFLGYTALYHTTIYDNHRFVSKDYKIIDYSTVEDITLYNTIYLLSGGTNEEYYKTPYDD